MHRAAVHHHRHQPDTAEAGDGLRDPEKHAPHEVVPSGAVDILDDTAAGLQILLSPARGAGLRLLDLMENRNHPLKSMRYDRSVETGDPYYAFRMGRQSVMFSMGSQGFSVCLLPYDWGKRDEPSYLNDQMEMQLRPHLFPLASAEDVVAQIEQRCAV